MFKVTSKLKTWLIDNGHAQASWTDDKLFQQAASDALQSNALSPELFQELQGEPDPQKVFGGVRLKKPSERYSTMKSVGKHVSTGQPILDEHGKQVELPSELEHAKSGAIYKMLARRQGLQCELNEHEKSLVEECFEDSWCGEIGGQYEKDIPGSRIKALLDDATSGGSSAVPVWQDSNLVSFALLHSELLPKVDLVEVSRGSSVEGASVANPSVTWGTTEGTEASVFDTTAMMAGISSDLHRTTVACEIGLDFLADSVGDVGRVVTENIGQSLLASLDDCIANGNGSNRPEGLFNASGITDVGVPAGGAGQPWQVADVEELLFGLPKQYRRADWNPCFVMNDVTYSRIRGIAVGAADQRRVFGMNEEDYTLFGRKVCIQNDIANNLAAFTCMKKYRLYRRAGFSLRWETGGRELSLKNLALVLAVGRFGGMIVDPTSVVFGDNFEA